MKTSTSVHRIYNYSAGPATLPLEVLEQARDEFLDYRGSGMSILESSHRGAEYTAIHEEAIENVRQLLGLTDDYAVLLLQGGATGQFAMVPMNLLFKAQTADYVCSGSWAAKAIKEAETLGTVHVAADTSGERPARMPEAAELDYTDGAAYLHITSNETIAGTQWKMFPPSRAPLVADMSSDMLSRPIDVASFGLIYAGAQKNLGPAGVTLVVIDKRLAERASPRIPAIWKYQTHIKHNSCYNTPPCFAVYFLALVTRWLRKQGGMEVIAARNEAQAAKLYRVIDRSSFYRGTAAEEHRSTMNVTFRLPSEELDRRFVERAAEHGMKGLKGHRSVGGIRASIYNAFPTEGVDALETFMKDFERAHG